MVITHPHFDHDAIDSIAGEPTVVRGPVDLRVRDCRIRTIMGKHAGDYGHEFGQRNLICVIEVASTTYCHIGDNEAKLTDEIVDEIGPVDVLMLPIDDSHHLLSDQDVENLSTRLAPSIVVPTHYFIPELTDPSAGLKDISAWLASQSHVRRIESGQIRLQRADLPSRLEVWSFSDSLSVLDASNDNSSSLRITTSDIAHP